MAQRLTTLRPEKQKRKRTIITELVDEKHNLKKDECDNDGDDDDDDNNNDGDDADNRRQQQKRLQTAHRRQSNNALPIVIGDWI